MKKIKIHTVACSGDPLTIKQKCEFFLVTGVLKEKSFKAPEVKGLIKFNNSV
jgi:hypothetical protein